MKNYWEADILITYNGVCHVMSEITPTAKARIYAALGRGRIRGSINAEDFQIKRER